MEVTRGASDSPGAGVTGGCDLPKVGNWELNLGPLVE